MKTIRSILAVCALFVCTCSFAQESKPTKEETIEWLKPKLIEYSSFKEFTTRDLKIEINECEVVISGFLKRGNKEVKYKSVFPTDFIKMPRGNNGKYYLKYTYEAYQTEEKGKLKPYSDGWHFLKMETPPEMANRIESALKNLQSYCGGQKSEDEPF
ncbi:MAG: hypothetical protein LBN74_01075 [Prevotella sp.]|jgi:hypothetical protein|nr:hypothetical protein [Prevotella sp.]